MFPFLLSAQIQDVKIRSCIEQYFKLNRAGPELVCIDMFDHPEFGCTIKIKILARRTQSGQDLLFAFAAAAAVANLAEHHIDLLWVEMDINFKELETTMALAPADCTIDAIILGNCKTEKWWNDCLQFP
ncbi:MAG: hypothetical protein HOG76_06615 [Candidatus Marinimicrobia bacterium]|nr:hypothetical protein [Candidatus Neomarinimicrobiota bacterium]MBT4421417.1 hypothetical protein [Candidatus Neomarinimicrobiota bacterium]MBT5465565.1 hypothetical protein [Candidatus Neomarinimicrobiota bacterium]MBT6002490.1 hypothetical protein [Candidatus Neomarinimicrobiota bacterium]MBT6759802.1 hypothetical protein [Candidatus Neomarinimicrobiota bacterium]